MSLDHDKTADEELRDYLTRDLALTKLRLNESRRVSGKLLSVIILLSILVLICVAGFTAAIFFITQEHTKQIQTIFASGFEVAQTVEREHIIQDAGNGSPAIINNRINNSEIQTKIDK